MAVVAQSPKTRSARKAGEAGPAKSNIDIELLIFFHAVADTLSFTKAAQKLRIDQSWLSHKIRQLESMLEVTLFIRNTRHVELTRAGISLLEPARKLAECAHQARLCAENVSLMMEGALSVGALPFSFHDPLRTTLMDRFMSLNPGIQVDIVNGSTPELLALVREEKLDMAFVSAPFEATGLDLLLLRENSFCLLMPEDHPLAQYDDIPEDKLTGVAMVVPGQQFSPATFNTYYQPLLDAGIKAVPVPEFQNAVSYAQEWMLPIACTEFAGRRDVRPGMTIRPLSFIPPCKKYLVRLSSHRTPSQNMLWDLAQVN